MKKQFWKFLPAIVLLFTLMLSACGASSDPGGPKESPKTSEGAVQESEGETPAPSGTSGNQTESTKAPAAADLILPEADNLLAWARSISEKADYSWGDLTADYYYDYRALMFTLTPDGKAVSKLRLDCFSESGDVRSLMQESLTAIADKLGEDFSEAIAALDEEGPGEKKLETKNYLTTMGSGRSFFLVESANCDGSALPFGAEAFAEALLGEDFELYDTATRPLSLIVKESASSGDLITLTLDEAFRVKEIELRSFGDTEENSAAFVKEAAAQFLKGESLKSAEDLIDEHAAALITSGSGEENAEWEGGKLSLLYRPWLGLCLEISAQRGVISEAAFGNDEDHAALLQDSFEQLNFSKEAAVPETDLGEIAGCHVTLNGLVYGEPHANGPEIGLRFTVDKTSPEALKLRFFMDRLDGFQMRFSAVKELPEGKTGQSTFVAWVTSVKDLRKWMPKISGLPAFTLSVARETGRNEYTYLVQDQPFETGMDGVPAPDGALLMDGDLRVILTEETLPVTSEISDPSKQYYNTLRYHFYVENRSEETLRLSYNHYKQRKLWVDGYSMSELSSAFEMNSLTLAPGEKGYAYGDLEILYARIYAGAEFPASLSFVPSVEVYSETDDSWRPRGEEAPLLELTGLSAPEIPERTISVLDREVQQLSFTPLDPQPVYEDDDVLIRADEWVREGDKVYLAVSLFPKKEGPVRVYGKVTRVNGVENTDNDNAGIVLTSEKGPVRSLLYPDKLEITPEETKVLALSLRKGSYDEERMSWSYYGATEIPFEMHFDGSEP